MVSWAQCLATGGPGKIHDLVPGALLTLSRLGEEAMNVVSPSSGELVLDSPHFLKHDVYTARGGHLIGCINHIALPEALPAYR